MTSMTFAFLMAVIAQAGEPPKEDGWQPVFLKMAEEYEIETAGKSPRKCELRPSPILRWSQPVRGGDDGATFVWMDKGRPAAIGTIFAYPNADQTRTVVHEFHSLAKGPIVAKWKSRTMGQPQTAGLEFKDVSGAPDPADKPAARMTQMRSLCRDFKASSTDHQGQPWDLRLMPQPLVRYQPESDEMEIDGAVFTFAQGTDPEILFVIEAQRNPSGAKWKFACGRFSDYQLEVKHKDVVVWQVDRWNYSNQKSVYFANSVESRKAPKGVTTFKDRQPAGADAN